MALLAKTSAFLLPEPNMGGDAAGEIFDGRENPKGNVVSSELWNCVYKGSKGLQGTSGLTINNEIINVTELNAR